MSQDFSFKFGRGGPGYTLDWDGFEILVKAAEAARRAIDEVTEEAVEMAKATHAEGWYGQPGWQNRTGQTEESLFRRDAIVEPVGTTPDSTPHVWGEWGVEARPRFHDETGELQDVTTKDVALFLEFGTVNMERRPWLYPVWDITKRRIPAKTAAIYRSIPAWWRPQRRGGPGVRGAPFMSMTLESLYERYGRS